MNNSVSTDHLKTAFEAFINERGFEKTPNELYEPLDYILSIGGKRFRPLALLAACQVFSQEISRALPAAYAIELFHNFSLIHDDIMDDAPLRRGEITVHEKWDVNTGILSGDAMLIYSFQYLNESTTPADARVINKIFTDIGIKVCEGQQMDVNFESLKSVSLEDYLMMIYKKTGALVEGAMKIGALIGGATMDQSLIIAEFAKKMGTSFQIQDDILDAYGKKAKVGKQIGGDIIQNKKTILYILAESSASANDLDQLQYLFSTESDTADKVSKVMRIFDAYNVKTQAEKYRDKYHEEAIDQLNMLDVPTGAKSPLIAMFDKLLNRRF